MLTVKQPVATHDLPSAEVCPRWHSLAFGCVRINGPAMIHAVARALCTRGKKNNQSYGSRTNRLAKPR
jgi:hypothetical protein